MPKIVDLTGQRFGRLLVLHMEEKRAKNGMKIYHCLCDCGKEHYVTTNNLLNGSTNSCGCYRKEYVADKNYVHGKSKTRLHGIWRGIKDRCLNQNNSRFNLYGGRGITICKEWKDDFQAFYDWSMKNGYADNLSIDRIDVNGNYEPSNCRWADDKTQANNKTTSVLLTMNGETHTISEWAGIVGIDRKTISDRITRFGWSAEKALTVKARVTYDHRRNKEKCVNARDS